MASRPSPLSQTSSVMEDAHMTRTTTLDPKARWQRTYDEGEDLTAPKSRKAKYMQQSFIAMVASAGLSSSISPDMFSTQEAGIKADAPSRRVASGHRPDPSGAQHQRKAPHADRAIPATERHRKSDNRMLQSSPGLSRLPRSRTHARAPSDNMLQSQILVPPKRTVTPPTRGLPRRSLDPPSPAQKLSMQQITIEDPSYSIAEAIEQERETRTNIETDHAAQDTSLPEQLASMFGIETQEEVVAEYPCDLLQGIQQSGYMYLLQNYLCFYAYLPKRPSRTAKSGWLLKRGRRNPRFNRYWFVLQGDVLSYYTDRSNQYFPRNTIDLRSGIFTSVIDDSDGAATFSIKTSQETFVFKAENQIVATEWAEQIKRITFRSHHTGDCIKIKIPLKNILDIEELQMGFTANMLSIKFIEDGEGGEDTFSVEEHIFSFLGTDPESFEKLRTAAREPNKSDRPSSKGRSSDDMEDIALEDSPPDDSKAGPIEGHMQGDDSTTSDKPKPHLRSTSHLQSTSLSSSQQASSSPDSPLPRNDSLASISRLYRAGTERLRQASGIAGTISQKSKLVGNLLTSESKGYYEKMSGMWAGEKTHYDVNENPMYQHATDDEDGRHKNHGDSFRQHFSLPASEKLQATFFVHLLRNVPVYGKVYVGSTKLCFRSLALPQTKMILPFRDIESVGKEKGFTTIIYSGIVIVVKGHEELFFEFSKEVYRDDFALTMIHILDSMEGTQDSKVFDSEEKSAVEAAKAEHAMLQLARRNSKQGLSTGDLLPTAKEKATEATPVIFDDFQASILDFKPQDPLHITCLTIGSRGDVQPYIALCKGLLEDGHHPVIATHAEFEPWIRSHGIDFRSVAGDPGKIMKLCVENDMFTIKFMQEAQSFRGFLDELFVTSWEACQGTDVLIESPSAMAGIHIAEALRIPYFRAFTMPWSPTRAYPHAFGVMNSKMGGKWNRYSYHVFDWAFWQSTAGQLNRFRTKTLRLPKTTFAALRTYEVPFLYNFSPSVVPPPLDFGPQIHITGYWFLDEGKVYTPPAALLAFIAKARADGKKLVYVGFGSVTVDDPTAVTRAVSEAVEDADIRCILCKGWSDRLDKKDASEPEIPLPDSIFPIKAAPHDWLFGQVDAAVHHGGAGTTGASLRAGKPTVIKPFFGDQHFFASRVDDLGVGIALKVINSKSLALALREATCEERMARRAKAMGERIRSENGVQTAIKMIYRDMSYARSLIKTSPTPTTADPATNSNPELVPESSEESWDLLSNESGTESPETSRKSTSTLLEFPASLGSFRREGYGYEHEQEQFLDGDVSAPARSLGEGAFYEGYDCDE